MSTINQGSSYLIGGVVGAAVLARLFDAFGWTACQAGVLAALGLAATLARRFEFTPVAARIAASRTAGKGATQ